ncbi:hypothetical protein APE_2491.1 [Aeropyrum pernix K1]|uniref:Uncharacterized protein n=1 Tax=Aeropyrum pernix (strain ATCC 700893 / DSM 11879 / JCM 9820 / NBRC 100138 / K1) TaxID=272557 RepID=Q9Y8Z3_AERPE|nr:hypothetical protein [Aeropyrum pernix]BAA81507.2 hypothetical protein APE_2491.1 [Aeropyrum pernix K1]
MSRVEASQCRGENCWELASKAELETESYYTEFYRNIYIGLTAAGLKYFLYSSLAGLVWSFSLFSVVVAAMALWGFDPGSAPNYLALVPSSLAWLLPKVISLGFVETFIALMFLNLVLLAVALWIYYLYRMVVYARSSFLVAAISGANPMLPGLSGYLFLVSSAMVVIGLLTVYTGAGTMVYLAGNIVYIIALSLYAFNIENTLKLARIKSRLPFYILLASPIIHILGIVIGLLGFMGFTLQFVATLAILARLRRSLHRLYGSNGEDIVETISKALSQ